MQRHLSAAIGYRRVPRRPGTLRAAIVAGLFAAAGWALPGSAAAEYPDHPIRLEVGFAAGGATDLLARALAQQLSTALHQPVIVENRGGAGGTIATNYVAKAAPDGYTLLYSSAAIASNAAIYKTLPYDPIHDFAPITSTFTTTYVMAVHPSLPVHSVKEFIEYAKSHKNTLTMASGGVGSSGHLGGVAFNHDAGIDVAFVPYKGTGDVLRDLIAGQVQSTVDSLTAYLPYIKDGRLRALCVGDLKRSPLLPETPTCDEAGVPGYMVRSWHGVLAPARTPAPIVKLLNETINEILRKPELIAQVQQFGSTPTGNSPEAFGQMIKQNIDAFTQLGKLAGIQPQ